MNEEQTRTVRAVRARLLELLAPPAKAVHVGELVALHERLVAVGYRGPLETLLDGATEVGGRDTMASIRAALAVMPGPMTIAVTTTQEAAAMAPTLRELSSLVSQQHHLDLELTAAVPDAASVGWLLDAAGRLRVELLTLRPIASHLRPRWPLVANDRPAEAEAEAINLVREAVDLVTIAAEQLRAAALKLATLVDAEPPPPAAPEDPPGAIDTLDGNTDGSARS